MTQEIQKNAKPKGKKTSLFSLLKPYSAWISALTVFTVAANAFNLAVPKIISSAIDRYSAGNFVLSQVVWEFTIVSLVVFVFTYLQIFAQTYAAEKVARDLRSRLILSISMQNTEYVQKVTPAKLLTNLTSDVDAIKNFVSMAISSMISSVFLIIGASALLLYTDWRMGLTILLLLPLMAAVFVVVFGRVHKLFKKAQEAIDWLNKVINESILGAAVIRLLDSRRIEKEKFLQANDNSMGIGFKILKSFALLVPTTTFFTNFATLLILVLGGHFVILHSMTLGDFTAFNAYLTILIMPMIVLSFMSNFIAQASASFGRLETVLDAKPNENGGKLVAKLRGDISFKDVTLMFGEKAVIKGASFEIKAGTKTAIIGPTAAGKTQLLYLLTGLIKPNSGEILFDGQRIEEYEKKSFHEQVAFVFQDSVLFNLSLKENIAFSSSVSDHSLQKAIDTAELDDLIGNLPEKLGTIVSERGTNLSGGQKQRLMLSRALSLDPQVLLLDDFTARVDVSTEKKILGNVIANYPKLTLVSVTQKIASIMDYDQIILLMEGEVLAAGKHAELMKSCPEYVQIFNSQKSTNAYEIHA